MLEFHSFLKVYFKFDTNSGIEDGHVAEFNWESWWYSPTMLINAIA